MVAWTGMGIGIGGAPRRRLAPLPGARPITGIPHLREWFHVTMARRLVDGIDVFAFRRDSQLGNLVATLESGPASDIGGNGTVSERVSVPMSMKAISGSWSVHIRDHKISWGFFPFSQTRMLHLDQKHIHRVRTTGGADGRLSRMRAQQHP